MGTSYSTDKNGWVKFQNKRIAKIKLRKWIADFASQLSDGTKKSKEEETEMLIKFYDEDGLPGVIRAYQLKMQIKESIDLENKILTNGNTHTIEEQEHH